MEEILKCKVCKITYNYNNNQPFIIKCGHTFCKHCILIKINDNTCPLCGLQASFKVENCINNKIVEEILKTFENGSVADENPESRNYIFI